MAYQQSNYPFKKVEWPKRKKKNQYKGKSKSGTRNKRKGKISISPEQGGAIGFLGALGKPAPVSENEINKIMGRIKEGTLVPKTQVSFDIGEQVKVCEGPFASFSGLVEEIDEERSRLKVSVSIFGRPTPIDLEYNQVEKY